MCLQLNHETLVVFPAALHALSVLNVSGTAWLCYYLTAGWKMASSASGEFMTVSELEARGLSDLLLVRWPLTSGSLGTGPDRLGVHAVNQAKYLMQPRSQAKAHSHLDEIATSGNYMLFLLFIIVCFAIHKHRLMLKACKSPQDVMAKPFMFKRNLKKGKKVNLLQFSCYLCMSWLVFFKELNPSIFEFKFFHKNQCLECLKRAGASFDSIR